MSGKKKAVVLLSGGLDSSVTLSIAKKNGYRTHCISFDYSQKHKREIIFAKEQARLQEVFSHKIFKIDFFGGSALTDDIKVPKTREVSEIKNEIPVTYVPARNTIFLSYALGYAESLDCNEIFIGVNAIDYSGYPDCRPEFINLFEKLANIATKKGIDGKRISINTPLIKMTKKQIILEGYNNKVNFKKTFSCYSPIDKKACGYCDSCLLRKQGFSDANINDPIKYI